MPHSAIDVLSALDDCARNFKFPAFDNGYIYPAGGQLCLYCDDTRWAISIQILGYFTRDSSIGLFVDTFSNCIKQSAHTENTYWPVADANQPLIDASAPEFINPRATSMLVRSDVIDVPQDPNTYLNAGIALQYPPRIQPQELSRLLAATQTEKVRATPEEMRSQLPHDLPLLLELYDWMHPDISANELPSSSPTFVQLAAAIANNDAKQYALIRQGNTHWSNWPNAGTL
jgi:hypothetical protein